MRSRILVLSGCRDDARLLSQMLHGMPFLIEEAADVRQARAKLQQDDYQSILTEAALPDGNWLDVLHLVRACPYHAEVVITSPQADSPLWAEALNVGVYDVLAQPYYAPEVRRIVANACRHRHHWERTMAAGG